MTLLETLRGTPACWAEVGTSGLDLRRSFPWLLFTNQDTITANTCCLAGCHDSHLRIKLRCQQGSLRFNMTGITACLICPPRELALSSLSHQMLPPVMRFTAKASQAISFHFRSSPVSTPSCARCSNAQWTAWVLVSPKSSQFEHGPRVP